MPRRGAGPPLSPGAPVGAMVGAPAAWRPLLPQPALVAAALATPAAGAVMQAAPAPRAWSRRSRAARRGRTTVAARAGSAMRCTPRSMTVAAARGTIGSSGKGRTGPCRLRRCRPARWERSLRGSSLRPQRSARGRPAPGVGSTRPVTRPCAPALADARRAGLGRRGPAAATEPATQLPPRPRRGPIGRRRNRLAVAAGPEGRGSDGAGEAEPDTKAAARDGRAGSGRLAQARGAAAAGANLARAGVPARRRARLVVTAGVVAVLSLGSPRARSPGRSRAGGRPGRVPTKGSAVLRGVGGGAKRWVLSAASAVAGFVPVFARIEWARPFPRGHGRPRGGRRPSAPGSRWSARSRRCARTAEQPAARAGLPPPVAQRASPAWPSSPSSPGRSSAPGREAASSPCRAGPRAGVARRRGRRPGAPLYLWGNGRGASTPSPWPLPAPWRSSSG